MSSSFSNGISVGRIDAPDSRVANGGALSIPKVRIETYDGINNTWGGLVTHDSSLITTTNVHHELYHGRMFSSGAIADLGIGDNHDIIVYTSTGYCYEFYFAVSSENESTLSIYENTTTQAPNNDGTAVGACRRNRPVAANPTLDLTHTPSLNFIGNLLGQQKAGSGRKAGGQMPGIDTMILNEDTRYLFRIHADAAGWVSAIFNWIEEAH